MCTDLGSHTNTIQLQLDKFSPWCKIIFSLSVGQSISELVISSFLSSTKFPRPWLYCWNPTQGLLSVHLLVRASYKADSISLWELFMGRTWSTSPEAHSKVMVSALYLLASSRASLRSSFVYFAFGNGKKSSWALARMRAGKKNTRREKGLQTGVLRKQRPDEFCSPTFNLRLPPSTAVPWAGRSSSIRINVPIFISKGSTGLQRSSAAEDLNWEAKKVGLLGTHLGKFRLKQLQAHFPTLSSKSSIDQAINPSPLDFHSSTEMHLRIVQA